MGLKEGGSEDLGHPFVICWSSTQLDSPPPQAIPSHPSINPLIPPPIPYFIHPTSYISSIAHSIFHLPTHPPTCHVCPFIRLSTYPPIHQPVRLSVYPSIILQAEHFKTFSLVTVIKFKQKLSQRDNNNNIVFSSNDNNTVIITVHSSIVIW